MTLMRMFGGVWFTVAAGIAVCTAQPAAFTVGTASAAPGQTAAGSIEVPAGSDAALSIPVIVVNGARPGPVLALLAGAHGTEYASIIALEKLPGAVDASTLVGHAHRRAAAQRAVVREDRAAPQPGGRQEHESHVSRAPGRHADRAGLPRHHHSRSSSGAITSSTSTAATSTRTCGRTRTGRRPAAPPRTPRRSAWCWRSASTTSSSRPAGRPTRRTRGISRTPRPPAASRRSPSRPGAPARSNRSDVAALVNGTLSVMKHLKMLPGAATPVQHPVWIDRLADVASEHSGIFYPSVERGSYVATGTTIGRITDYVGRPLAEVRAAAAGVRAVRARGADREQGRGNCEHRRDRKGT